MSSFTLTLNSALVYHNNDRVGQTTFYITGNAPFILSLGQSKENVSGEFERVEIEGEPAPFVPQLTGNKRTSPGEPVNFENGTHVPPSPHQLTIPSLGYIPLDTGATTPPPSPYPGAFAHWAWKDSIADVSANNHQTTNALIADPVTFGVDNVNGKPLSYVTFSGANYINVTLNATIARPFTISGWVHPNNAYLPCVEFNEDHGHIVFTSSEIHFYDTGGAAFSRNISSTQWTHFAFVYDNSILRVYFNGTESLPSVQRPGLNLTSTTLKIGFDDNYNNASPPRPADRGTKLGELIVLKTTATAAQIQQIYDRSY